MKEEFRKAAVAHNERSITNPEDDVRLDAEFWRKSEQIHLD